MIFGEKTLDQLNHYFTQPIQQTNIIDVETTNENRKQF